MDLPASGKVTVADCKEWNFDGSSTNQVGCFPPSILTLVFSTHALISFLNMKHQAAGHDSDVFLRPVAVFKDPFRRGNNVIVLAECYNSDGTPNKTNHRSVLILNCIHFPDSKL